MNSQSTNIKNVSHYKILFTVHFFQNNFLIDLLANSIHNYKCISLLIYFQIFKLIKELLTNRYENLHAVTEDAIQRNMNNMSFLQRRIMNTTILK